MADHQVRIFVLSLVIGSDGAGGKGVEGGLEEIERKDNVILWRKERKTTRATCEGSINLIKRTVDFAYESTEYARSTQ